MTNDATFVERLWLFATLALLLCGALPRVHAIALPHGAVEVVVRVREGVSAAQLAADSAHEHWGELRNHAGTRLHRLVRRNATHDAHRALAAQLFGAHPDVEWHQVQTPMKFARRDAWDSPTDSRFAEQWFLGGARVDSSATPVAHANIQKVWQDERIFGTGITFLVIDDGVNVDHPDLASNYAGAALSYNYERNNNYIQASGGTSNHGTPVASTCCGVNNDATGRSNSNECGVGAAPRSKFAVVRDLLVTRDSLVAEVLNHKLSDIDIYLLTSGPADDGRTMQSIGSLARAALDKGVATGRDGLGAVYMWSAGNGGQNSDDCNFDGFAADRRTIAAGAITALGRPTYYSERCAAMLAVAPSSGANNMARGGISGMLVGNINSCSDDWGGTSGTAPLMGGVIALWLEALPELTWLDVQGLLAYSSSRARTSPENAYGWLTNGAGLPFSHDFGFGVVDAERGLAMGRRWQSYALSSLAAADSGTQQPRVTIASPADGGGSTSVRWTCTAPADKAVKWVEVVLTVTHARRGDLLVQLRSPAGSVATLAHTRPADSGRNFVNFKFTSVATWDESPAGEWTLLVRDTRLSTANGGTLDSWRVFVHYSDPNNFTPRATRPLAVDAPPRAASTTLNTVVAPTPMPSAAGTPQPADAVPFTVVPPGSAHWRFRTGPLRDDERSGFRWADPDYVELPGPQGDLWRSGSAPFGYGVEEERDGLRFGTRFANDTAHATFRFVFRLSAAQMQATSRFEMFVASDDYATLFINGIPLIDESPPPVAREYAYWNARKEFSRSLMKVGDNVFAGQLFNALPSSDMIFDAQLDALVMATAGSFPPFPPTSAPTPAPTPNGATRPPTPAPTTRVSNVVVTVSGGAFATDENGDILTSQVIITEAGGATLPEAREQTLGPGAERTTNPSRIEMPPNDFDATLGTGVGGLVYIIAVGACCVFCSICAVGVALVGAHRRRRSRARRRRQYERARSETSMAAYVSALDDEKRKLTDPEAYDARTSADAKSSRKASKSALAASAVPKGPRRDRSLPKLSASGSATDEREREPARDKALPPLQKSSSGQAAKARSKTAAASGLRKSVSSGAGLRQPSPSAPPARELTDSKAVELGLPVIKLDGSAELRDGDDADFRSAPGSRRATDNAAPPRRQLERSTSVAVAVSSSSAAAAAAMPRAQSAALATSASSTSGKVCANCGDVAAAKVRVNNDKTCYACARCATSLKTDGRFPAKPKEAGGGAASRTASTDGAAPAATAASAVERGSSSSITKEGLADSGSSTMGSSGSKVGLADGGSSKKKPGRICVNCGAKAKIQLKIGGEIKLACRECGEAVQKNGKWPKRSSASPSPAASPAASPHVARRAQKAIESAAQSAPDDTHGDLPPDDAALASDEPPPPFDATVRAPDEAPPPFDESVDAPPLEPALPPDSPDSPDSPPPFAPALAEPDSPPPFAPALAEPDSPPPFAPALAEPDSPPPFAPALAEPDSPPPFVPDAVVADEEPPPFVPDAVVADEEPPPFVPDALPADSPSFDDESGSFDDDLPSVPQ